jgi:hypothetical protein
VHFTTCDGCGKPAKGIKAFSEFDKVVPYTESVNDGLFVQRFKPVFKNERELCFPCFNFATQKYIREANKKNQID